MKLINPDEIKFVIAPIAPIRIGEQVYFENVTFKHDIEQIQRIEAEPVKHAHWIEFRTNSGNVHYKCSHCGKDVSYPYAKKRWKYCIECGARMDDREGESKS